MTIHVVRETGGLGDVIRIFAALDGLAAKFPAAPIHYHGPEKYEQVVMQHCAAMQRPGSRYIETGAQDYRACRGAWLDKRRVLGYAEGDQVIDLNCPAYRHEAFTHGTVTRERTGLWCEAAGVPASTPGFGMRTYDVPKTARALTELIGKMSGRCVGLHPRSAALIRMWRPSRWRELELALLDRGAQPIWFDDTPDYLRTMLDRLRGRTCVIGQPIHLVAAAICGCDAMVTIDSSLFHLAGALGVPAVGLFGATNGDIIRSIYPTARYVQAPLVFGCKGTCYGFGERGFIGGPCLDGCVNLAAVTAKDVMAKLEDILK